MKRFLLALVFVATIVYVGASILEVATSIVSAHTTAIEGGR